MVLVASPVAFGEVPEWLPVRCWWVPVCTEGASREALRARSWDGSRMFQKSSRVVREAPRGVSGRPMGSCEPTKTQICSWLAPTETPFLSCLYCPKRSFPPAHSYQNNLQQSAHRPKHWFLTIAAAQKSTLKHPRSFSLNLDQP